MDTQVVRRPDGPQAWEDHRAIIIDLYIKRGLELGDVMDVMEKEHFFKATEKQYKSHFTAWGIRKNVKSNEWDAILRKKRKREQEGKQSAFRLGGTPVDSSRIIREEKRRKPGETSKIAEAVTPPDLICSTPSPVARSPISSPFQLSEPLKISTILEFQRVPHVLRPEDLYLNRWLNWALEGNNTIKSFRNFLIKKFDPLYHGNRGTLIDAIEGMIQTFSGYFPSWTELVFKILEASRAKCKPSKRDNGSEFDENAARLMINTFVELLPRERCDSRSSFIANMDFIEQSQHSKSEVRLFLDYMIRITTWLISDPCAVQMLLTLRLCRFLRHCAVFERCYRNAKDSESYLLTMDSRLKSIMEFLAKISNIDPQTGADNDHRPEDSPSCRILLEACADIVMLQAPTVREVLATASIVCQLDQERGNTRCRIGSPAPPSPGSDRSQISFLSDPVVDWKELVHGHGPHDSTQGNAEAWIDSLEKLE